MDFATFIGGVCLEKCLPTPEVCSVFLCMSRVYFFSYYLIVLFFPLFLQHDMQS